jgi:hypothetical protein
MALVVILLRSANAQNAIWYITRMFRLLVRQPTAPLDAKYIGDMVLKLCKGLRKFQLQNMNKNIVCASLRGILSRDWLHDAGVVLSTTCPFPRIGRGSRELSLYAHFVAELTRSAHIGSTCFTQSAAHR